MLKVITNRSLSLRKLPCRTAHSKNVVIEEENKDPVAPPSPGQKAAEYAMKRQAQRLAFTELLVLKGANGGELKKGQIRNMAKKYTKRGWKGVSEENLHYRLKVHRKGKSTLDAPTAFKDVPPVKQIVIEEKTETSSLSFDESNTTKNNHDVAVPVDFIGEELVDMTHDILNNDVDSTTEIHVDTITDTCTNDDDLLGNSVGKKRLELMLEEKRVQQMQQRNTTSSKQRLLLPKQPKIIMMLKQLQV